MSSTPITASEIASSPRFGVSFLGLAPGASWTLAASISAALSQWLLLMVTAKLGSAEMVGQLALSFAMVAPVQALTDLALRPALATDARRDFHFRDYLNLRGTMIAIFVVVVSAAALWRGGASSGIIVAVALQKAVESAADLFFGLFQREDRLKWMGQSVVLRSTLASLAFVGVMLAYGNLLAACLAGLAARIGVFLLHDARRASALTDFRARRGEEQRRTGELLRSSVPLAMGLFLMSFAVNVPRYFVEKRMGVAELGIFAALIYIFQAGAMLIDAVSQAACARLAQYHVRADDRAFCRLLAKLCGFAVAASAGGMAIALAGGAPLLRAIYSAAFAEAAKPFVWLSICALPWYCSSVFGYALVARRQMRAFFLCQVVTLSIALGGSFWLIHRGSLSNACLAVFLIYSAQLVLYGTVLGRGFWSARTTISAGADL